MIDIATRVYNHNWKIDPIFRSMLDTDFYKILMSQFIFREKKNMAATVSQNVFETVIIATCVKIGR